MRFGRKEGREDPLPGPQIAARTVGQVAADGSLVFDDGCRYVRGETTITETGMAMTQYDPLPGVEVVPPRDVEVVTDADRTGVVHETSFVSHTQVQIGNMVVDEWELDVRPTGGPVARRGLDLAGPSVVLDPERRDFAGQQDGVVPAESTEADPDRPLIHGSMSRRPRIVGQAMKPTILDPELSQMYDSVHGITDTNSSGEA